MDYIQNKYHVYIYDMMNKEKCEWMLIVFVILLFMFIIYKYFAPRFVSSFRHIFEPLSDSPRINYYVITMSQPDRLRNVDIQTEKLMKDVTKVDAVVGNTIDLDDLIKRQILTSNVYDNKGDMFTSVFEKRKNEVGCYLSHLKIYDLIRNAKNDNYSYSVVFEDDFELTPDFLPVLEQTLLKLEDEKFDFDMLFLGISGNTGDKIIDNVYYIAPGAFGAYGYVISNKNIDRIIEKMKFIDNIVDVQIFSKGAKKELTTIRLSPVIVNPGSFATTIR